MSLTKPVGYRFRVRPGREASGKTSILGQATCTAEELTSFARRRNAGAPDCAGWYVEIGERYGVRGDLAYCQAMYDTKMWTKEAPPSEEKLAETAEARIRELRSFAVEGPPFGVPRTAVSMAQDERKMKQSRPRCWEDLNGKWPGAGDRYGQDIVSIWRNLLEWAGKGGVRVEKKGENGSTTSERNEDDLAWLRERRLLPLPEPSSGRGVTWGELAALLRRLEERRPEEGRPGNAAAEG